jgi:hypothetical protein
MWLVLCGLKAPSFGLSVDRRVKNIGHCDDTSSPQRGRVFLTLQKHAIWKSTVRVLIQAMISEILAM